MILLCVLADLPERLGQAQSSTEPLSSFLPWVIEGQINFIFHNQPRAHLVVSRGEEEGYQRPINGNKIEKSPNYPIGNPVSYAIRLLESLYCIDCYDYRTEAEGQADHIDLRKKE